MISPPRYETRPKDTPATAIEYGVFDTFTQEWLAPTYGGWPAEQANAEMHRRNLAYHRTFVSAP